MLTLSRDMEKPFRGPTEKADRPDVLENAPMHYAPRNEQGVVFLFSDYAKKNRIRIEEIRTAFPDCIAYQKTAGGEKRVRIEFEYRAKNFLTHGHTSSECDWIVCWENNWPSAPEHLRIIELRVDYGLGHCVWMMPVESAEDKKELDRKNKTDWSVPATAHKGDLILFYYRLPDKFVKCIFKVDSNVEHKPASWFDGEKDYQAVIRKVAWLECPLHLSEMQNDKILATAGFVRGNLQGRRNVSAHRDHLLSLILKRNPRLNRILTPFL
jgi:hypothetical protein